MSNVSFNFGTANDALGLPHGSSATRPTGNSGLIRFNDALDQFEGYKDSTWAPLGSNNLTIQNNSVLVAATGTVDFSNGGNVQLVITNNSPVTGAINVHVDVIAGVNVAANDGSVLVTQNLNFINTSTVNVAVTANGTYEANIGFSANGTQANLAYVQANAAYVQANAGYVQANAGYVQANAGYTQANSAYAQANLGYALANASNAAVNSLVSGTNTQVLFNLTGAVGGSNNLTYNVASNTFSVINSNVTFAVANSNVLVNTGNTGLIAVNTQSLSVNSGANGILSWIAGNLSVNTGGYTANDLVTVNTGILTVNTGANAALVQLTNTSLNVTTLNTNAMTITVNTGNVNVGSMSLTTGNLSINTSNVLMNTNGGSVTMNTLYLNLLSPSDPILIFSSTSAAAQTKNWRMYGTSGGSFYLQALNDQQTIANNAFSFARTANQITSMSYGSSDSPQHNFYGPVSHTDNVYTSGPYPGITANSVVVNNSSAVETPYPVAFFIGLNETTPNYSNFGFSSGFTYNPESHTLVTSSDRRLKTNITNINNAITIIKSLNGVRFNWQDTGANAVGVIAQDVQVHLPELVKTAVANTDLKGVNYSGLIGVLIEAVKAQQEQIEALQERLSRLNTT